MQATGQTEIENGLILNSPTLEINQITYKQQESVVSVECIFKEEGAIYEHSRNFDFPATKDMLKSDVLKLISDHAVLKQFV